MEGFKMSTVNSSSSSSTTTSNYNSGSTMRITGMASGLDVDSLVKAMLTADQTKIDQAKKDQQTAQWKQTAYQSIITDIKSLQSSYFDVGNSANCLTSASNYNSLSASSTDSSIATATANSTAVQGTYNINVTQMAKSAVVTGSKSITSQVQLPTDLSGWKDKDIKFSLNGDTNSADDVNIHIDGTGISSASDLVNAINKQIGSTSGLSGNLSASLITDGSTNYIKFNTSGSNTNSIAIDSSNTTVNDLKSMTSISSSSSSSATLTSLTSDATTKTALTNKLTLALKYDGKDIAVSLDNTKGGATVNDLVQAISTATGGKVTGKIDDMSGKLTLQTSDTGSTASLQIESSFTTSATPPVTSTTTPELLTALGINNVADSNGIYASAQGADAIATITEPGGTAKTVTETSNSFTINGVNYNLASVSPDATTNVSLSVTANTQAIYDKISGFLDKYNSIVDEIQTKLTEKKDYDYPPLTDAQKSGMSDTQITAWETKAKTGILANDSNLQNLLDNLRSAFTTPLTASGSSITSLSFGQYGSSAIGIDTSNEATDGVKVTIQDASKLKAAIANNPDQLIKLFTNLPSSKVTDTTEKFNQTGIFQRISTILTNNVGATGTTLNNATLTQYANLQDDASISGGGGLGTIPDQIYDQQLLITKYTTQYTTDQTNYYNKFSQLESLITQMNAQQSSISSMTSG
jgi:flagellar hook-associated protein 2